MSQVSQLIRACIASNSTQLFRQLRAEFVLEEEIPLYQFVRTHLANYNTMPSPETVSAAGFNLMRVTEGPEFYLNAIRNRHAWNQINEHQPNFVQAMHANDSNAALAVLRQMIAAANMSLNPNAYSTLEQQAALVVADYEYAMAHPGLRGVPFAWPTLNEITLGAMPGDLAVIAGRPGMGKSWLLIACAYAAWMAGFSVAVVSMEMTLIQLARRFIGMHTGANPNMIRSGELSPWSQTRLYNSVGEIAGMPPVHFMAGDMGRDTGAIDQMISDLDPDMTWIDASYFLSSSKQSFGQRKRHEEMSEVMKELKGISTTRNRPIGQTVQLNRNVKKSSTRSVDAGDVAGADSISQDTSILVGTRLGQNPYQRSRRTLDTVKNREGEERTFACNFTHTPVNMSECEYIEPGSEDDGHHEGPQEQEWMV